MKLYFHLPEGAGVRLKYSQPQTACIRGHGCGKISWVSIYLHPTPGKDIDGFIGNR